MLALPRLQPLPSSGSITKQPLDLASNAARIVRRLFTVFVFIANLCLFQVNNRVIMRDVITRRVTRVQEDADTGTNNGARCWWNFTVQPHSSPLLPIKRFPRLNDFPNYKNYF